MQLGDKILCVSKMQVNGALLTPQFLPIPESVKLIPIYNLSLVHCMQSLEAETLFGCLIL